MKKLLIDENLTPDVASDNWELGVDTATVRDRGLPQASDSKVFEVAQVDGRTIITVNFKEYLIPLARKCRVHAGVIVVPPYLTYDEQRKLVASIAQWIVAEVDAGRSTENRIVTFSATGTVVGDEYTN